MSKKAERTVAALNNLPMVGDRYWCTCKNDGAGTCHSSRNGVHCTVVVTEVGDDYVRVAWSGNALSLISLDAWRKSRRQLCTAAEVNDEQEG